MQVDFLHNIDLHRNRLLRSAAQALTTPPSDPVLGEFLFANAGATDGPLHWLLYDGVAGQGAPAVPWSILGGTNRNETLSGLWTLNPANRGAGTATGEKAPFAVGPTSVFDTNGILRNWVAHLNADLLDGRHALEYNGTQTPSANLIPVYGTTGRLSVGDPSDDYDAVNKKTWQAGLTGLIVLAPVRVASTARFAATRSGNTLTATSTGVLVVDGTSAATNDRVLLKDQQSGGSAVDNGIYSVSNPGAVGVAAILTRSSDADQTGELTIGGLVFVNEGTINRATQWSVQHVTGETGPSIDVNVQGQNWVKSFQQSAYTAGCGLVLNGLEFNFSQNADYTVGNLFTATAARVVTPLANPSAARFLHHAGGAIQPTWKQVTIADISDWPLVVVGSGTTGRLTRWTSATRTLEDSNLLDVGAATVGAGNTLVTANIGLGSESAPYKDLWTNLLRLKPSTGVVGKLSYLAGVEDVATDPNANHRRLVLWSSAEVKTWLAFSATDAGAVPTTRTLSIVGTAGQIAVATQSTWDLSDNRTWTLSLDLAGLDQHWMTLHTDQDVSGTKSWYSTTASASEVMLATSVAEGQVNSWNVTSGGTHRFGDGVAAPAATIDFANDRLRFSGKPVHFDTTAVVRATSALSGQGVPAFLLGLTVNDDWQRVNASDISNFVGNAALTAGAVGYGDATNRLTGDPAIFKWDATNKRLGIGVSSPAYALDVLGTVNQAQTITSAAGLIATYPGLRLQATDTSANNADWTNRTMIGSYVSIAKTGTAAFVTAAFIEGMRISAIASAGSVSNVIGLRLAYGAGNSGAGASSGTITGVYSQPTNGGLGSVGTITNLYQFLCLDSVAPFPLIGTHYGFRCANLTSGAGATTTAGLALELSTAGSGSRFNVYATGTAPNYFAGNMGLGITAPAARLEFAVGSTALAPLRFAPTSAASTLLSAPIAGAVESRGDRLTFTDITPTRKNFAFLEDVTFTNDASATESGAVLFGQSGYALSTLETTPIGQGDVTLSARFQCPPAFRGPSIDGIMSISSDGANPWNNSLRLCLSSGGALQFIIATALGNYRGIQLAGNFFTLNAGRTVDVVGVRQGTTAKIFVNGVQQTTSDFSLGTVPPWDMSVDSRYLRVGQDYSAAGSVGKFYKARVFNRALTAAEVLALSRDGVHTADMWAEMDPYYVSNFTGTPPGPMDGWDANGGSGANLVNSGNVGANADGAGVPPSNSWQRSEVVSGTNRAGFYKSSAPAPLKPSKRTRIAFNCFVPAGSPILSVIHQGYNAAGSGLYGFTPLIAGSVTPCRFEAVPIRQENLLLPSGNASGAVSTHPVGTKMYLKDVVVTQIGCLADLDFGQVLSGSVRDWSGRYAAVLNTSPANQWEVLHPQYGVMVSGDGEVTTGLRRYSETISVLDNGVATVNHNLDSKNLVVSIWNATGQSVQAAVQRKTGTEILEKNTLELGFALIGAPTIPVTLTVVVVG